VVARFILGLKDLEMRSDQELGVSTIAPTLLRTDQSSPNVTPGEVWLTCDCRTVPGETSSDLQEKLQALAERALSGDATATVEFTVSDHTTYTGLKRTIAAEHPAFLIPNDHPAVSTAVKVLSNAIGVREEPGVWRFATDGGHFASAGQTVIGFGPGDDRLAHTIEESIPISEMEEALIGNRVLALEWPVLVQN
jgi:acetylornithine deacetylase/succinyl-diaminopimelate desuccinylase-like protein